MSPTDIRSLPESVSLDQRLPRVLLRRHLVASGMDDRGIARAVRRGELVRVRFGAYADGPAARRLTTEQWHALTVRAVLLTARCRAVVSHASALVELGAPTWGIDLSAVHLTREDRRPGRLHADVRQHGTALAPGDVHAWNGLLVTTPAVTALDVLAAEPAEPALCAINDLLHRGLAGVAELDAVRQRHERRPGTLGARVVLGLADPLVESPGESRALYLFWRQGLPRPQLQVPVLDGARTVARVDFAWPRLGVFAEFDGRIKYGRLLRPGQEPMDVVEREKAREERVERLTGWRCVRLVWGDLDQPDRTAWRIRSMFREP